MRTSRASLNMQNAGGAALTVLLEPWGEDYTMLAGGRLRFDAIGAVGIAFDVAFSPEGVAVTVEGPVDSIEVFEGEERVKCGHNREHSKPWWRNERVQK